MAYHLEGRLLEVCNCRVLCPCWIGENPDEGTCDAFVAYHFDKGEINGVDVSALALAWLLAQGDDVIPIPGTTKPKNLDTNIQALSISLTPEENEKIRAVVESAGVAGGRYHAA